MAIMPPPVRRLGSVVQVVDEYAGEGLAHWDWFRAKGNSCLVRGHDDRGGGEGGDADQGLGVEQQCAGDSHRYRTVRIKPTTSTKRSPKSAAANAVKSSPRHQPRSSNGYLSLSTEAKRRTNHRGAKLTAVKLISSRHSAFYTPLIACIAGGFLEREGLTGTYTWVQPGTTPATEVNAGRADVGQAAVSSSWPLLEQGKSHWWRTSLRLTGLTAS